MGSQRTDKFHPLLIVLHWLTLLLLVAVYCCIELRGLFPHGMRDVLKAWHFIFGITIFVLTPIRLLLSFVTRSPPIVPPCPGWQMFLAKSMEYVLYALLLAMPLLGYLAINADGRAVDIFGIHLPVLIGPGLALEERLSGMHSLLGRLAYLLIAAHAGAALYHHYVQRDNTLRRMLLR
ncbi:MAG: cytochrome b [Xanthomonadaceae bacterium]|jgi:cytochrome b561|nr:cytochrome b [Xanthomonadaceae bacterium]